MRERCRGRAATYLVVFNNRLHHHLLLLCCCRRRCRCLCRSCRRYLRTRAATRTRTRACPGSSAHAKRCVCCGRMVRVAMGWDGTSGVAAAYCRLAALGRHTVHHVPPLTQTSARGKDDRTSHSQAGVVVGAYITVAEAARAVLEAALVDAVTVQHGALVVDHDRRMDAPHA
jgi:hypothetical protein